MREAAAANSSKLAQLHAVLSEVEARYLPAVFTSSFGAEDMVLFDVIASEFRKIRIVTLDTGRLPEQTYDVWRRAEAKYACKVEPYLPETSALEGYIRINGVNAFYDSVAQRQQCCHVRKVEPLRRALSGKKGWVTGLRSAQAASRANLTDSEFDTEHGLQKFNPLHDWSEEEIWDYLRTRDVPYNALHDQGYPSIGCAPCTRAVIPGQGVRSGRWWWEDPVGKECGIHSNLTASVA